MRKDGCPICDADLTVENQRYNEDNTGVLEEKIICENCEMYEGSYFYGIVQVKINGMSVGWGENASFKKRLNKRDEINDLVEIAKKEYKGDNDGSRN